MLTFFTVETMHPSDDSDDSTANAGSAKWVLEHAASAADDLVAAPARGPVTRAFDEAMANALDASGVYRVLRRIELPPTIEPDIDAPAFIALDVETTGLGTSDEIIELAMARVRYDMRSGEILGVERVFSATREPTVPLPEDVSRLVGLRPQDLAGHSIDPDEVADFVAGARLVIAHNSAFDRPHVERTWPLFAEMPWACSCVDIAWRDHGFDGRALSHLVLQSGAFHDGHRSLADVVAMLHLLALVTSTGAPLLASLLERARTPTWRVWADGAPFSAKDCLKARGFRWSGGERGTPRAWYRDLPASDVEAEVAFLRDEILDDPTASPPIVPIAARDRFTDRAGLPAGGDR